MTVDAFIKYNRIGNQAVVFIKVAGEWRLNKGTWYAAAAYGIWGAFPLYWKRLENVSALQLIGHRIVWSCLVLLGIILCMRRFLSFHWTALTPKVVRIYIAAALLIAVNWLVYVWAATHGFIVEASLGYFINPLLSIFLGVVFLRERLRAWQWVPIGMTALGVLYLTFAYGRPPWIALVLAFTFGLYGLVKKTAPLTSLSGLALETGLLFVPAMVYLIYQDYIGQGAFLHTGTGQSLLMAGTGLITTIPLLFFASAAQRIPLYMMGILQYITPTLQFLIGVGVYREPFPTSRFIGFGIVWLALVIFGIEGVWSHRIRIEVIGKTQPQHRN